MMKNFILLFAFLPLLLLAGIKLDIDGRSAGMNLKAVACTAKMSYQHPAWAKSKGYLIFTRGANSAWGKYFITFVSDKDGELTISRSIIIVCQFIHLAVIKMAIGITITERIERIALRVGRRECKINSLAFLRDRDSLFCV